MFPTENDQLTESQNINSLLHQRNEVLKRLFQLRLVIDALKEMRVEDLNVKDTKQLQQAQKVLNINEYLELQDGYNLLDLKASAQISYVESKAVNEYLCGTLTRSLKEKYSFKSHLIDNGEAKEDPACTGPQPKLLVLEAERRTEILNVATLRNQKCALLKQLLDGYVKSNMNFEVEKMLAESRLEAAKTQVLYKYMLNEFANRSGDFPKALKIVKTNMDEIMQEGE